MLDINMITSALMETASCALLGIYFNNFILGVSLQVFLYIYTGIRILNKSPYGF